MALLLGIDGGGTKTRCVLADNAAVLATATGGGANLNRCSPEQVRDVLRAVITELCSQAGVSPRDIAFACLGAAGASRSDIRETLRQMLEEIVPGRIEIVGDMEIAFEAAFQGSAGIIVLAGTGSIAYGRDSSGETARAGGWGHAISDEGSGYWIGRHAVSSAMRTLDMGQSTRLGGHVLRALHVSTREELAALCNHRPLPQFSELFPEVLRAAEEGDLTADELLQTAASQLGELALVILRKLWPARTAVPVVLDGGVLRNSSRMREVLEHSVRSKYPEANVRLASAEPVMGALFRAARFAAESANTP